MKKFAVVSRSNTLLFKLKLNTSIDRYINLDFESISIIHSVISCEGRDGFFGIIAKNGW